MKLPGIIDVALRFAGHAFPDAAASTATVLRRARDVLREMEDAVLCERSCLPADEPLAGRVVRYGDGVSVDFGKGTYVVDQPQDSRPAPPAYPPPEQVAPGPEACRHPTRLNGQCLRCGDRGALSRHTLSDADEVIRDGATRG